MDMTQYDKKPEAMINYLRYNGPHFSKKLCEFATKKMRKKEGRINPWGKAEVDEILNTAGVEVENDNLYDTVFVANMCKADYYKSSVADKAGVARYIKDVLDDEDGYDGIAFNRWLADCARKGVAIPWDDVL